MTHQFISFDEAVFLLKKGEVVAIPTETVYGLAGSIFHEEALKKIFQIKKRPFFNPLIVHCYKVDHMNQFHCVNESLLKKMTNHFCPGPITFVLEKTDKINPLITAHHSKVGLRVPKHPLTLRLIQKTGLALCAPSANLFSTLSPSSAEQAYDAFKGRVPVLDGGSCKVGIESTVVEPDFLNCSMRILRPGMITEKHLMEWLQLEQLEHWTVQRKTSSISPGQMVQHYRPAVPFILIEAEGKISLSEEEKIKQFLNKLFPQKIVKRLKLKKSAEITARYLYHDLNILSKNPDHIIYTIKPDQLEDLWQAIWDRLRKASSLKFEYKNGDFHKKPVM